MSDDKFNKSDDLLASWDELERIAAAIPQHPDDYYIGLPETPWLRAENILLFTRRASFAVGQGSHHHRFLLVTCLKGAGSVIVDDQVVRLAPRASLAVLPHQFHHYADFTAGPILWLFMTFELENEDALNGLRGRAMSLTPFQLACLQTVAGRYAALHGREPDAMITLTASLLLESLRGGGGHDGVGGESTNTMIQAVARYVHRHIRETIRLADVAKVAGLSESHLRARFRALAGMGLGAYIRQYRLHRARMLLVSTGIRMKEVADRCGYDSLYVFSRAFRNQMGMSPSQYRRRNTASGGRTPP